MEFPDEILLKIFSSLDPAEKSVICMSVCRRWRAVVQDSSLWTKVAFKRYFHCSQIEAFFTLPYIAKSLYTLQLNWIPNVPLFNLRELHVSSAQSLGNVTKFMSLELLCIRCWSFETQGQYFLDLASSLAASMPKLKIEVQELRIQRSQFSLDVCARLNNLKATLTVTKVVLAVSNKLMNEEKQTHLQKIHVAFPQIAKVHTSVGGFEALTILSNSLTEVSLKYITKVQAFKILPNNCPNLQECHLLVVGETEGAMPCVNPLPRLVKRSLSGSTAMSEQDYFAVLSAWTNLKVLSISYGVVTRYKVEKISQANPLLKELFLTDTLGPPVLEGKEKVKFPALNRLTLNYNTLQLLRIIHAPVCTALLVKPLSDEEVDFQMQLEPFGFYSSCPILEEVNLPLTFLMSDYLEPLAGTLHDVSISEKRFDQEALAELEALATTCPEITKLQLDIDPFPSLSVEDEGNVLFYKDYRAKCAQFGYVLVEALTCFKMLETCALNVSSDHASYRTTHNVLRECLHPAKSSALDSCYERAYYFFPPALRKTLALQGFVEYAKPSEAPE